MALYQEVWDPQTQSASEDVIMKTGNPPMYIPNDEANEDWRNYQTWLKAGNTPDPPTQPKEPQSKS